MTQEQSRIWQYLQDNHVINIAVCCPHDHWAFTAFYAPDTENSHLIIFSGATTRHGIIMQQQPQITGTISDPHQQIAHLTGLQFTGIITLVAEEEQARAFTIYQQAFPFIKEMPKEAAWHLSFDHLKLTDNSLGFGTKIEWKEQP